MKLKLMSRKGEFSITLAFTLFVGIIAVSIFLLLIFSKFPYLSRSVYCSILSPLKVMFSLSSGTAEEAYCSQDDSLQNSTIKMEKVILRSFSDGSERKVLSVGPGLTATAHILVPATNITRAKISIFGYSLGRVNTLSDGSTSKVLDFSKEAEQTLFLKLPKDAHVLNASFDFYSKQEGESSEVLVFTGYSNKCGQQYGSGMFDDVRKYLYYHLISYDESKCWKGDPNWKETLAKHSVLIVGSGLNTTIGNSADREYLKDWIAEGNTLMVTGWAINLLVELFSESQLPEKEITPYFKRITPYQNCPGLLQAKKQDQLIPSKGNSPDEADYKTECNATIPKNCNDKSIVPCRETVGFGGRCGESQRITFSAQAEAQYGVSSNKQYSVIYDNTPCVEVNYSNSKVKVLADLVYNSTNPSPLDKDLKLKCADRNYGRPGQAVIEFSYGNGSVIYIAPNIEEQLGSEFGDTNFMINAIISRLKKSSWIKFYSCNSAQPDWQSSGSFKSGRTAHISSEKLNSWLRRCIPDQDGNCIIPLKISAMIFNSEPIISIENLSINYQLPIRGVLINVFGVDVGNFEVMKPYAPAIQLDITKQVSQAANCKKDKCEVTISAASQDAGEIVLSGIEIEYGQCSVSEVIAAYSLACWEKARFGERNSDLLCYEITIPSTCTYVEDVDEDKITKILKENGLCETLGNSDFNCGRYDQLKWRIQKIIPGRNVLIEYSEKEGAIIVS
ncbi:MAG: hypothetical protein QXJ50_03575 [Candidatus Woesearchaeota archaeon]